MLDRMLKLWKPDDKLWTPVRRIVQAGYDTLSTIMRRDRRGRPYEQRQVRLGPNEVHAWIGRRDGSIEDLGVSRNLLTNIGRDAMDGAWGFIGAGVTTASPASTVTATAITVTGTPLTASNLATPQLGLAGQRIFMPVTAVTTAPVYGNIVSNTNQVITIDKWWTVADATGTTPGNTNAFQVAPGGLAGIRFVALSTNASAASAANTTLTGEVTASGCGRVLALYAHTFAGTTLTLSNTFTASGTVTAIHKAGAFSCLTAAGADPMFFETVMNADATLASGDTLALTWTFTLSG